MLGYFTYGEYASLEAVSKVAWLGADEFVSDDSLCGYGYRLSEFFHVLAPVSEGLLNCTTSPLPMSPVLRLSL